jgi:molecular chaperone DnaK (HSP70)
MDGKKWTPAEISALILAKLKRECSRIIGEINDVVITVPANFNELARKNTVAAADMAGLKVRRLVNEPTAAAVYYAHTQAVKGRILVFDLGGGTLDVTILEVDNEGTKLPAERTQVRKELESCEPSLSTCKNEQAAHVLEAHEALTKANEENKNRFRDVIEFLEKEVRDKAAGVL